MMVPTVLTTALQRACLRFAPLDCHEGGKIMSDTIVTAGKQYPGGCNCCQGPIVKGQRSRAQAHRVNDGEFINYRWCTDCCIAQAISTKDAGKQLAHRFGLYAR
jgi:hypothetical protein